MNRLQNCFFTRFFKIFIKIKKIEEIVKKRAKRAKNDLSPGNFEVILRKNEKTMRKLRKNCEKNRKINFKKKIFFQFPAKTGWFFFTLFFLCKFIKIKRLKKTSKKTKKRAKKSKKEQKRSKKGVEVWYRNYDIF